MYRPHFVYPSICGWTHGLLSPLGYCGVMLLWTCTSTLSLILYSFIQHMFTKCNVPSSEDQMKVNTRIALPSGSLATESVWSHQSGWGVQGVSQPEDIEMRSEQWIQLTVCVGVGGWGKGPKNSTEQQPWKGEGGGARENGPQNHCSLFPTSSIKGTFCGGQLPSTGRSQDFRDLLLRGLTSIFTYSRDIYLLSSNSPCAPKEKVQ